MAYYTRVLGEASASALKEFREYPLKYWHWCHGLDRKSSTRMHLGTAFHCALHEPEKFSKRYVTLPDMPLNSKAAKQEYLDATVGELLGVQMTANGEKAEDLRDMVASKLAASGIYLLTENELATMRRMVDSLNLPCHALARGIVSRGKKELVLRWKDEESGVQCKAKLDSWDQPIGLLSDLKNTTAIAQHEFRRHVLSMGYAYQDTFYRRGLRANGCEVKRSYFVCVSPDAPHPWAIYEVPDEVTDACDARISADLIQLAECLSKNAWPTINAGEPVRLNINPEYI